MTVGTAPSLAATARDQIRVTGLWTVAGLNYWARRPVTRLDLDVGRFDEVPSDEVEGFTARLVAALPALVEHECSVGRRGGFVERLERGTYAPHIIEHVGLALQNLAGDDVGYGRARGAERPGSYVVALAHRHAAVGRAAALQATALVRAAFDGEPLDPDAAVAALRAGRALPDDPAPTAQVDVAVYASTHDGTHDGVRVTPARIVTRGLPYAAARTAVVLEAGTRGVPVGFRAPERLEQLLTVMVDGLAPGGRLVCPEDATALQDYARERGHPVAVFAPGEPLPSELAVRG
ncbi:cyanophycin synthetase family protein [Roseisolibacter agri]|uniref:Cyanophycin synthase-like N-terminal domain-containing protein n=1 Tax=Roseisolibacter agri TaxID=2014610 RepID=A0AA37Q2Y7_9BACT|nr:hypothetical protein [Roseisolibacter agri]GLC25624.1 hypothetical protein rosag_21370 [Roseisolibacter agri]